jgi:hypothetical protein
VDAIYRRGGRRDEASGRWSTTVSGALQSFGFESVRRGGDETSTISGGEVE